MPKTRNEGKRKNTTKYPLRSRTGGTAVGVTKPTVYREQRERGIWTGGRPTFSDATWLYMLHPNRVNSQIGARGTEYECPECGEFFHRKRDLTKQMQKDWGYITLDHKISFQHYIHDNAAPNNDGRISSRSATIAYNDVNNLEVMCNFCNSSKNGTAVG